MEKGNVRLFNCNLDNHSNVVHSEDLDSLSYKISQEGIKRWWAEHLQVLVSLVVSNPAALPRFKYPSDTDTSSAPPPPEVGRIHLARHHTQDKWFFWLQERAPSRPNLSKRVQNRRVAKFFFYIVQNIPHVEHSRILYTKSISSGPWRASIRNK